MSKGKNVENKNIENQNKRVRWTYKLEDQTEEDLYFNIILLSAFLSIKICIIFIFDIFIFDVFPFRHFSFRPNDGTPSLFGIYSELPMNSIISIEAIETHNR
jgi:hypothetical protein